MDQTLYNFAQRSLTISLLKLRSSSNSSNSKITDTLFSFPELVERLKKCKGIEVIHLISALPQTGLRPDYRKQVDSSKSKISAAGTRLRDSYRGEGKFLFICKNDSFIIIQNEKFINYRRYQLIL